MEQVKSTDIVWGLIGVVLAVVALVAALKAMF